MQRLNNLSIRILRVIETGQVHSHHYSWHLYQNVAFVTTHNCTLGFNPAATVPVDGAMTPSRFVATPAEFIDYNEHAIMIMISMHNDCSLTLLRIMMRSVKVKDRYAWTYATMRV